MSKAITKFKTVLSKQQIVLIYALTSLSMELLSLVFFDCHPYIHHPLFPFLLWTLMITLIAFFRSQRCRAVLSFLLILLQSLVLMASNYLFLSNGTVFERSMFKQRNDAYATIEEFMIKPGLVALCIVWIIGYFIFLKLSQRKKREKMVPYRIRTRIILGIINLILVSFIIILPYHESHTSNLNYSSMLYKSGNSYQKLGVSANLFFELFRGENKLVDLSHLEELEDKLYEKRCDTSSFNGISKGNNLIMILAESLEWYPLTLYPQDITKQLYPNLSQLLEESIHCDNFYSREKTDTAEALTLVGANPTGKYVHNDFGENAYPYSLPNMFRRQAVSEGDEDVRIRSFHQNDGSFYNRTVAHKSFGFEELVDISKMQPCGVENTWNSKLRERNLDSMTMHCMKDEMFPTDRRFFTYWITFSTHGFYKKRENLSEYYKKFDELGVFKEGDKYQNYLRTYAAAVADLDKAIGIMMDDLRQKNLLSSTTILMVADHNTYYNGLSNYVKKIKTQYNSTLYRVPMMIYDQKLSAKMDQLKENKSITKFTTTSDVIPTILDLFGIAGWDNLYLGSTVFNKDKESIIFSRAYNIFITDKYIGYSLKDLKYKAKGTNQDTKKDFEKRALEYLNNLSITDKIFYSNYFSNHEYKP